MAGLAAALTALVMLPGQNLGDNLTENMGLNPKTLVVQQDGLDVSFTYQRYKIDLKSVCSNYIDDITLKSDCSHAALKVFREGCSMDSFGDAPSSQVPRLKGMFCNAAYTYKPIIARITSSTGVTSRTKSSPECNLAILSLMSGKTPEKIKAKNEACNP
jgi:hypothetical protein